MTAKVVQLRDFNEVVRITGRKLAALEDWVKDSEKKRNSFEVSIGENLLELRDRVDAGEIGELANWWEWFEDNRMLLRNIARRTAERYLNNFPLWMWRAGDLHASFLPWRRTQNGIPR
jgi:hypothetical protein